MAEEKKGRKKWFMLGAIVKAYRALGRFDRSRPFRPWLLRIVVNEARNLRRAEARRAVLELRAAAAPDSGPGPEDEAAAQERREALLAAVNRLDEADREVIGMRYFLELGEAETAAALGVAVGTVKSRLSRALGRPRAGMEASADGVLRDAGAPDRPPRPAPG